MLKMETTPTKQYGSNNRLHCVMFVSNANMKKKCFHIQPSLQGVYSISYFIQLFHILHVSINYTLNAIKYMYGWQTVNIMVVQLGSKLNIVKIYLVFVINTFKMEGDWLLLPEWMGKGVGLVRPKYYLFCVS